MKEVEHLREELSDLHEHHQNVEVVVDGTPYKVPYNDGTSVKALIREALQLSGNSGRSADEWQVKYDGKVLDEKDKIKDLHLPDSAVLFLSLRAGILG